MVPSVNIVKNSKKRKDRKREILHVNHKAVCRMEMGPRLDLPNTILSCLVVDI